jgi:hypothetical protein
MPPEVSMKEQSVPVKTQNSTDLFALSREVSLFLGFIYSNRFYMRKTIVLTLCILGLSNALTAQSTPVTQTLVQYERSPRLTQADKSTAQRRLEYFQSETDLLVIALRNQNKDLIVSTEAKLKNAMRELVFAPDAAGEKHEKQRSLFEQFDGFSFLGATEDATKAKLAALRAFEELL